MSTTIHAKFSVGQVIYHKLFDYRGVIVDVDACFAGDDEWYDTMATSCPPKDNPWYHVLVHNAVHRTYVAEVNLVPDDSNEPIDHPEVEDFFSEFHAGMYRLLYDTN